MANKFFYQIISSTFGSYELEKLVLYRTAWETKKNEVPYLTQLGEIDFYFRKGSNKVFSREFKFEQGSLLNLKEFTKLVGRLDSYNDDFNDTIDQLGLEEVELVSYKDKSGKIHQVSFPCSKKGFYLVNILDVRSGDSLRYELHKDLGKLRLGNFEYWELLS